jgi:putative transposase
MVFQKAYKTPKTKEPPDKPKFVYILNDYTGKQKGKAIYIPADKRKRTGPFIACDERGMINDKSQIISYHVKHDHNLSEQLNTARKIAELVVQNSSTKHPIKSTAQLKAFDMKSAIANQIIRKYKNPKIKRVTNVNLILPNQSIKYDVDTGIVYLTPLKIRFYWKPDLPDFLERFQKINAIEISDDRFMLSVSYSLEGIKVLYPKRNILSLDHNCGYGRHIINGADHKNQKVINLGKSGPHIRYKYQKLRQKLQKAGDYSTLKKVSNKEQRRMRDLDHKISRAVVDYANKNDLQIVVEDLGGIRKNRRKGNGSKKANRLVNSWSFYRLMQFIRYKSELLGIPVTTVNPERTSQLCSYCHRRGDRSGIDFQCTNRRCGKKMNSDVNAAYNIGKRFLGLL